MALLADLVLLVHVGFIMFVVVGLVVVLAGGLAGWEWVHNAWFRLIHLGAMLYVTVQAWLGADCPLTVLETDLRVAAGQEPYTDNGFIADWLHRLFFFQAEPWVFILAYTVFGTLVALSLRFIPIRWGRPAAASLRPA